MKNQSQSQNTNNDGVITTTKQNIHNEQEKGQTEANMMNNKEKEQIIFQITQNQGNGKENESHQKQIKFPHRILSFNIELLNNNHEQPYPIPKDIVNSELPFQIMRKFLSAHEYSPDRIKIVRPINSANYKDLVDPITFDVLEKYTLVENAEQARLVVDLTRFIRFHELHDGVCAAIATNYYIPPNDEKELNKFKKQHKIDNLKPEEICQIIKEYEDVFNLIEAKGKEQLIQQMEMEKLANEEKINKQAV